MGFQIICFSIDYENTKKIMQTSKTKRAIMALSAIIKKCLCLFSILKKIYCFLLDVILYN